MGRSSRSLPLVSLGLALLSLASFALPMYVITPFRHQGPAELDFALFVKQIGPWVSIGCVALALGLVVAEWRQKRGWISRSIVTLGLTLTLAGAYLARLNVYELMFHPLGPPQFSSIEQAHLEKDDMLLAIGVNGVARAYPIRELAYHHVVNDTVGSEPIVATY